MALHWATHNIDECLPADLAANLKSAQTDPYAYIPHDASKTIPMYNGKTGDLVTHVGADGPRRVHRGRLRDFLRMGLDVRFGREMQSFSVENGVVTARFNNGEEVWTGAFLIGADGPRSKVRGRAVPENANDLTPAPLVVFNFGATFTAEQASSLRSQIHSVATLGPHPEQKTYYFLTMGDVKNPNDPASWVFQVSLSYWPDDAEEHPKTQEERMALFKKLGSNYCEPFKSVAEWVKPDTHLPIDHFGSWTKIQPWDNFGGRVLLAGDAAHPMVPYRAQGLNNALEDCGSCVRTLISVINGGQDVVNAVASYDKDVYERGKSEISLSNTQMYACHHWDVLMESKLVRDGFAKC
ncbi:FAD binding domain-containing protein [Colletotrichum kahawae]|uniref:FAD binding domain-containing protein n=1 Tax=Colletotrichum kahawae TaxID=34407 RepID=A0AAE0D9M0_COLKA|nr:FAD binding domain-containing protein [Colletotrichum kahawae]